jgi:hypothetical protein
MAHQALPCQASPKPRYTKYVFSHKFSYLNKNYLMSLNLKQKYNFTLNNEIKIYFIACLLTGRAVPGLANRANHQAQPGPA